jgi:hypothetical protein
MRRATDESPPLFGGIGLFDTSRPAISFRDDEHSLADCHTCTMGMIVRESVQKLSRKGIWVAAATSWRAYAATAVYCRTSSAALRAVGSIAESVNVLCRGFSALGIVHVCILRFFPFSDR